VLLEVNAILASPSRTNKMMSIDVLFVTHSDWDPLILQSCQLGSSDPAVMSPPIDLSLRGIRRCHFNRRHSWILLSPASTFLNIVNIQGSLRLPCKTCRQDMTMLAEHLVHRSAFFHIIVGKIQALSVPCTPRLKQRYIRTDLFRADLEIACTRD
jgi:hypothetical protein